MSSKRGTRAGPPPSIAMEMEAEAEAAAVAALEASEAPDPSPVDVAASAMEVSDHDRDEDDQIDAPQQQEESQDAPPAANAAMSTAEKHKIQKRMLGQFNHRGAGEDDDSWAAKQAQLRLYMSSSKEEKTDMLSQFVESGCKVKNLKWHYEAVRKDTTDISDTSVAGLMTEDEVADLEKIVPTDPLRAQKLAAFLAGVPAIPHPKPELRALGVSLYDYHKKKPKNVTTSSVFTETLTGSGDVVQPKKSKEIADGSAPLPICDIMMTQQGGGAPRAAVVRVKQDRTDRPTDLFCAFCFLFCTLLFILG